MSISRNSSNVALAFALALPATMAASPAQASDQYGASTTTTIAEVTTPSLGQETVTTTTFSRSSAGDWNEERFVGDDGVETIVRTRYITRPATALPHRAAPQTGYPVQPMMPQPAVFERDQWLDECERRTSGKSEKEKGGIIGGLLGAAAGGIAGNLIAGAGERLAGTLIGAGTGGLAGVILGSIIGGGKKNDRYDCEAALDGYTSQYGYPGSARTIAYPYPPSGYQYMHTGQYSYAADCGCQYPQVVMVPVRSEVRQRLITRERTRIIETPVQPRQPGKLIPIKTRYVSPEMIKN